jgi:radical SAM protein with 4Fe4S-binding SPASM domain
MKPETLVRMPVLPVPAKITISITDECNLRCRHCHIWRLEDPDDRLTTSELRALGEQIAAWTRRRTWVTLTGGEPFLRPDSIRAVIEPLNTSDVPWMVTTAGTRIDPSMYDEILRGRGRIVFSLDSPAEKVHDRHRGRPGTFRAVTDTIAGLARRKREAGGTSQRVLAVTAVLGNWSIPHVVELVEFCRGLGADRFFVQALQPTFAGADLPSDKFYEAERVRDPELIRATFDRLIEIAQKERARGKAFVEGAASLIAKRDCMLKAAGTRSNASRTAGTELVQLTRRDTSNGTLSEDAPCGSARENLMIRTNGDILLCHEMPKIFPGDPPGKVGNVRSMTLEEAWRGEDTEKFRTIMDRCNRPCGALNCHMKRTFGNLVASIHQGAVQLSELCDAIELGPQTQRDDAAKLVAALAEVVAFRPAIVWLLRGRSVSARELVLSHAKSSRGPTQDASDGRP